MAADGSDIKFQEGQKAFTEKNYKLAYNYGLNSQIMIIHLHKVHLVFFMPKV